MYLSLDAATGRIIECNQVTAETLGYRKGEIVGREAFELYHPDCAAVAHHDQCHGGPA